MEKLLHKKIEMIEGKIAAEIKQAKAFGTKNKSRATNCLRRKKALEKQLQITSTKPYRKSFYYQFL